MFEIMVKLILKGSVVLIDPKQIVRYEIITHINVLPSIVIDIQNIYGMPISLGLNTGLFRYICEIRMFEGIVPVVAIQMTRAGVLSVFQYRAESVRISLLIEFVGDYIHIEVTVIIIVEESSHGRL